MSNGHTRLGRRTFLEARRKFNESSGPEDDKAGFALLKKSASLGCIEAHEWLGYVYDYGYGTRRNRNLAFKHYMTAARSRQRERRISCGRFLP